MKITAIEALEILDSRGSPTVECHVILNDDVKITASVPAGASVGTHEAYELRDGVKKHYNGRGVKKAVKNIETLLAPPLIGKKPNLIKTESFMAELDGTPNKENLGANAMLAVSIAIARAQAHVEKKPLYQLLNKLYGCKEIETLPLPMFNMINGGAHANNKLLFQEFLIIPQVGTFEDNLEAADTIFAHLGALLDEHDLSTAVGDEGGYAPKFKGRGLEKDIAALEMLKQAIVDAEVDDVIVGIDAAASQFYDSESERYILGTKKLTADQLIGEYKKIVKTYEVMSIEDALDENDADGWVSLNTQLGEYIQLVGDDVFVTNPGRIKDGIKNDLANAVIIKPNQIGSIGEAVLAVQLAQKAGWTVIVSHRSGETNDDFIADFAVAVGADQLKAGAPNRGERVAKYNRLLDIAEGL